PMGVGVVVQQVVSHCVHDLTRHLSAARAIEVRDRLAVMPGRQSRELAADLFDTGDARHGHSLGARCWRRSLILSSTTQQRPSGMQTRPAAAIRASTWILAGCVALSGIAAAAPPAHAALVALEPVMVD